MLRDAIQVPYHSIPGSTTVLRYNSYSNPLLSIQAVGMELPVGRRKSIKISLLTSLVEGKLTATRDRDAFTTVLSSCRRGAAAGSRLCLPLFHRIPRH